MKIYVFQMRILPLVLGGSFFLLFFGLYVTTSNDAAWRMNKVEKLRAVLKYSTWPPFIASPPLNEVVIITDNF